MSIIRCVFLKLRDNYTFGAPMFDNGLAAGVDTASVPILFSRICLRLLVLVERLPSPVCCAYGSYQDMVGNENI